MGDNFGESEWKKDGQTIDTNIKSFKKSANEMKDILVKIEKDLADIKGQVEPKIKAMKEKIKGFNASLMNNKKEFTEEEIRQLMEEKELAEKLKNNLERALQNEESIAQTKKELLDSNFLEQEKKTMELFREFNNQLIDEIAKIQSLAKTDE